MMVGDMFGYFLMGKRSNPKAAQPAIDEKY